MKKLFGVAVVAFFLTPAAAMAANQYTVTTAVDEQGGSAQCSLREAITNSNTPGSTADCPVTGAPSVNTIIFSPSLGASPTINLNGSLGQLDVQNNAVTIQGPATVNQQAASGKRVLESNVALTLTSMTI